MIMVVSILLGTLSHSCTTSNKPQGNGTKVIKIDTKDQNIGNPIKISKVIALETNKDCLVGSIYNIVFSDNRIIILDQSRSKAMFIFDGNGIFLFKTTIGKGPGEIANPRALSIDKGNSTILLYERMGQRFSRFDLNGSFIESNTLAANYRGLNITNLKIENHDTSPKLGFHIGPITEIPFGDIFALETGVLISTKGNKLEETVFGITTKYKTNLVYLDIPINVKAGYDFGKTRVYGILGPNFAFGLTGKYKSKIDDGGDITKTDTKVEWGSDGSFKRFDSGLTIGACAAVSIFELGISYSHGFVNIATGDIHNTKNRVFSISAAYKFGKNPFKK